MSQPPVVPVVQPPPVVPLVPPLPAAIHSIVPSFFSRVRVHYAVRGSVAIYWELGRRFAEPLPYTFTVQVGRTGLPTYKPDGTVRDDDWVDVGSVVNHFTLDDNTPRLYGKTADVHYRVKVLTGSGLTYYSDPVNVYGELPVRDYLVGREIIRKEQLRHIKQASVQGYLLKAYRYGPLCTCVDPITKEIRDSRHAACYGTGFVGGYFPPVPSVYADVSTEKTREALDPRTGTSKQQAIQGRFLAEPQIYALDVWINKMADARYYIHPVKVEAQVRGVPLVISAELRIAPFSDIIYTLPVTV